VRHSRQIAKEHDHQAKARCRYRINRHHAGQIPAVEERETLKEQGPENQQHQVIEQHAKNL
jgi:hypothetical protein